MTSPSVTKHVQSDIMRRRGGMGSRRGCACLVLLLTDGDVPAPARGIGQLRGQAGRVIDSTVQLEIVMYGRERKRQQGRGRHLGDAVT